MIPGQKTSDVRPPDAVICEPCVGSGRRAFNAATPLVSYQCDLCDGRGWALPQHKPFNAADAAQVLDLRPPSVTVVVPPPEIVMPTGTPQQYRYAKAHLRSALQHLALADHYVPGSKLSDMIYTIESQLAAAANLAAEKSIEQGSTP